MDEVTCVREGVYDLRLGAVYPLLESLPTGLRIRLPDGRARWFPGECFAPGRVEVPRVAGLHLDPGGPAGFAEVVLTLSTGERHLLHLGTPEAARALLEGQEGEPRHLAVPSLVLVPQVDEETARSVVGHLERQGELLACSRPL